MNASQNALVEKKKRLKQISVEVVSCFSDRQLLSCQPRVTVMSCFVYKLIRDLESLDHLFINPICKIGLIHK